MYIGLLSLICICTRDIFIHEHLCTPAAHLNCKWKLCFNCILCHQQTQSHMNVPSYPDETLVVHRIKPGSDISQCITQKDYSSSLMHAMLLEKQCQNAAVNLIFEFSGFKSAVQVDNIQTDPNRSTQIPSLAAGKSHKFLNYTLKRVNHILFFFFLHIFYHYPQ